MGLPDQLTVARILSVPIVIVLYEWEFPHNEYWATVVFALAMATDWLDGRLARRWDRTSALGSLLDPIADKILVLSVLIVLIGDDVFPAWMVALIVAREFLVSGLRLAAIERGVVLHARDLGKLKTWAQAVAAGVGRLRGGGRLGRHRRMVGAARRARPDLDQRARLRPRGTRPLQAARRSVPVAVLRRTKRRQPPGAGIDVRLARRAVQLLQRALQDLPLARIGLGNDLDLHGRD